MPVTPPLGKPCGTWFRWVYALAAGDRTGETITIAAKRNASFKPGKELTEKLAQHEIPPTPEEAA